MQITGSCQTQDFKFSSVQPLIEEIWKALYLGCWLLVVCTQYSGMFKSADSALGMDEIRLEWPEIGGIGWIRLE